eukprot:823747_1
MILPVNFHFNCIKFSLSGDSELNHRGCQALERCSANGARQPYESRRNVVSSGDLSHLLQQEELLFLDFPITDSEHLAIRGIEEQDEEIVTTILTFSKSTSKLFFDARPFAAGVYREVWRARKTVSVTESGECVRSIYELIVERMRTSTFSEVLNSGLRDQ